MKNKNQTKSKSSVNKSTKSIAILLSVALILTMGIINIPLLITDNSNSEIAESTDTTKEETKTKSFITDTSNFITYEKNVTIETEKGNIVVELYPEIAPKTVENFVSLINNNFYDNLTFHRVIEDFMIQGGDPEGTGVGGSENTITGEFSANGWDKNNLSHTEGVISMARSDDFNSASSQFFICTGNANYLDGQYAAFGKVIEGLDVAKEISKVEKDSNDKPNEDIHMLKVYLSDK